jgi:hypothetical protein
VKNTPAYDVTESFIALAPEMSENKGQNLEEAASIEKRYSRIFGK